jgi:predicted kinase
LLAEIEHIYKSKHLCYNLLNRITLETRAATDGTSNGEDGAKEETMFQRLDELQTGSLYILTGQAGAGKSHLAASARRAGTLWVLDTEGAAQNLAGKPGIHRKIQVLQSVSLKALLAAMDEIRKVGKAGDTVLLDSISKVFQAMRAHAQRRAGAETDRKTGIGFDEHASVNRNMQAVYTALTELKQAGFHVLIIGHMGRKYRADESGLHDDGLRVLADDQIAYEADAILLVEREGDQRSIMPIIKPPRPAHLRLNKHYPAQLATLYPDLVPEGEKPGKTRTTSVRRVAETLMDDGETADTTPAAMPETTVTPTPLPASPANAPTPLPRDAYEAEQRFYARYGDTIGGTTWLAVQSFLNSRAPKPVTIEGWIKVGEQVRDRTRQGSAVRAA